MEPGRVGKKLRWTHPTLSASLVLAGSLQVALGRTAQVVLVLVLLSECSSGQVGKRGGSGVGGSHSSIDKLMLDLTGGSGLQVLFSGSLIEKVRRC